MFTIIVYSLFTIVENIVISLILLRNFTISGINFNCDSLLEVCILIGG